MKRGNKIRITDWGTAWEDRFLKLKVTLKETGLNVTISSSAYAHYYIDDEEKFFLTVIKYGIVYDPVD